MGGIGRGIALDGLPEMFKARVDPEVERLLELVELSGRASDEELLETIELALLAGNRPFLRSLSRLLQREAARQLVRQDPYFPYPPSDVIDGPIKVGRVIQTGDTFGLYPEELNRGLLICGSPGTGKSNLVELLIPQIIKVCKVFIADMKRDYIPLANVIPDILVMDISDLRFNPLEVPEGVDPNRHAQVVSNIYRKSLAVLTAGEGALYHSICKLYEILGVNNDSEEFPNLFDLLDYEKKRKFRPFGPESQAREREINRLLTITLALGETINCSRGFSIEKLLGNNIVLLLDRLNPEIRSFILGCILTSMYSYRISNGQKSPLRNIIVIDDCKSLLSIQEERRINQGVPTFTEFLTQSREFGFGHILTDHMPTFLASAAKAASHVKIMMPLGRGEDYWDMARCMGLDQEQLKSAYNLAEHEAIIKLGGRWAEPFKVEIFPSQVNRNISLEEIDNKGMLDWLMEEVRPRAEVLKGWMDQRDEEGEGLLFRLLSFIYENPELSVTERVHRLGWSTKRELKLREELMNRGYIDEVKVMPGRVGREPSLYEVTAKGKEWLEQKGYKLRPREGRGGPLHRYFVAQIRQHFERAGAEVRAEVKVGDVWTDLLIRLPGGERQAVQCCVANEIEDELRNLRRLAEVDWLDGLIFVAMDKRVLKAVKSKCKGIRADWRLIGDFLPNPDGG